MLVTGVGPQHTPATRLWFGKANNAPGFRSLPHHHGEAETGAYLLSGRARIYFGKDYQDYVDMAAGDFMVRATRFPATGRPIAARSPACGRPARSS